MTITQAQVAIVYPAAASRTANEVNGVVAIVDSIMADILVNCDYSVGLQTAIEQYLAAHFLIIGNEQGGIVRKRTGESEERYRDLSIDLNGIGTTNFGQQALALDYKGCLAILASKSLKATFRVV